jgi:hypothetical protein
MQGEGEEDEWLEDFTSKRKDGGLESRVNASPAG